MDYIKPDELVANMGNAGVAKAKLAIKDMLIRGMLSGMILGVATTLAFQTRIEFAKPVMGGVIFPVGFVMIVLLGLELVTGNFAVLAVSVFQKKLSLADLGRNWGWVFLGNLIGALIFAGLFMATTKSGAPVVEQIKQVAVAKTVAYENLGMTGMKEVFFKAMLCNWLVTMGVVMALTSSSTIGKIGAMWLPIMTFFAQGFEHSVVNMFVIPAGMSFGADVSFSQWWVWNQIPVTLGNLAGGLLFTGMALYLTYGKKAEAKAPAPAQPAMAPARMSPVGAEAGGGS
jgi:formate transporter